MMKRRLRATLFMAFAVPLGISAALGFGPGVASAGLGHVWLGAHTKKDIKDHCDAAGGMSFEGSGTYGCWGRRRRELHRQERHLHRHVRKVWSGRTT